MGARYLPRQPVRAVRLLNLAILVVVALTAVAAAAVIVVTVSLAAPEGSSAENKELLSAVAAAVTTFLAAVFVATDKSDEAIGGYVQGLFEAAYGRDPNAPEAPDGGVPIGERFVEVDGKILMPVSSNGHYAVFSDGWHGISGWSRGARIKRARALQDYLSPPLAP